jgi:hypothetical protein
MLIAVGVAVWIVCGLWAGMPHVEEADNIWLAALVGAVYLVLGPVGLLVG